MSEPSWVNDYPKLSDFLKEINQYNETTQKFKDAQTSDVGSERAEYYQKIVREGRGEKTDLLGRSGLIGFVKKRFREEGVSPEIASFRIDNDGRIRTRLYPPIDTDGRVSAAYKPELTTLRDTLKKIGIPGECIERAVYYDYVHDKKGKQIGKEKQPLQYFRIDVDDVVVHALIEKAVEREFGAIQNEVTKAVDDSDSIRLNQIAITIRNTIKQQVTLSLGQDNTHVMKVLKDGLYRLAVDNILGSLAQSARRDGLH